VQVEGLTEQQGLGRHQQLVEQSVEAMAALVVKQALLTQAVAEVLVDILVMVVQVLMAVQHTVYLIMVLEVQAQVEKTP
jgi:hypothetical protein